MDRVLYRDAHVHLTSSLLVVSARFPLRRPAEVSVADIVRVRLDERRQGVVLTVCSPGAGRPSALRVRTDDSSAACAAVRLAVQTERCKEGGGGGKMAQVRSYPALALATER